jgi:two-component system sensor histidine kinase PilS (NtrC family)
MQSGLLTLNASGVLVYFNRTAGEILGLSDADVTGRHCNDVLGERMPELARLLIGALRSDTAHSRTELLLETARARTIPVGISTSLLGSRELGVRGVIAIFQDLTEAKRLEDRIRVADRLAAVGELAASIAHEIRNPLAIVTGSVEMLQQGAFPDQERASLMRLVLKESARLNRIVSDFLDFARVKQQACREVDLTAVAEEVKALFEHHPTRGPQSDIVVRTQEGCPHAAAATDQVKQMLVNLVQNALEALPGGEGEVVIAIQAATPATAGTRFVEIAVVDTGSGIPSTVYEKIGQPFFSTKKGGTGLGLAIVQRLAIASGGSLRWAAEPKGGARFTLRLPTFSRDRYREEVSGLWRDRQPASG